MRTPPPTVPLSKVRKPKLKIGAMVLKKYDHLNIKSLFFINCEEKYIRCSKYFILSAEPFL